MKDWIEYIDNKLTEFEIYNLNENKDSFYPHRYYRINGTYISFEFEGVNKLKKIEFGKYYLIENNPEKYTISNAKIVFNKFKHNYVEIIENTYDGENNPKYELEFNDYNTKILDEFLKIPIEIGWTEEYYKFKDFYYKIKLEILNEKYKTILSETVQQDVPMPLDRLSNRIEAFILDLKINDKHRKIELIKVNPIKEIAQ